MHLHCLVFNAKVRMYQKYSEQNSWKCALISSSEVCLIKIYQSYLSFHNECFPKFCSSSSCRFHVGYLTWEQIFLRFKIVLDDLSCLASALLSIYLQKHSFDGFLCD